MISILEYFSGKNVALRYGFLVGKQKHSVQKLNLIPSG